MRCLKVLLTLTSLAAGRAVSPRASEALGPDSLNNSSTLALAAPLIPRDNLPANVPSDFWTRTDRPSSLVTHEDNLPFEILHCSDVWDDETSRVGGACHYLAGEVAKDSELHLYITGTRSMVATCNIHDHITVRWRLWKWFIPDWRTTNLPNGLCYYDPGGKIDYIRISPSICSAKSWGATCSGVP